VKITATPACFLAIAAILALSAPAEARLSSNKLATNRLAANKLSANRLSSNNVATNKPTPDRVASREAMSPASGADGAFTGVSEIALPNGVRLVR
jgi:hypothetical protein